MYFAKGLKIYYYKQYNKNTYSSQPCCIFTTVKLPPCGGNYCLSSLRPTRHKIGSSIEVSDLKNQASSASQPGRIVVLPTLARLGQSHPCSAKNTIMRVTLFGSYPTYSYTMTGRFSVRSL